MNLEFIVILEIIILSVLGFFYSKYMKNKKIIDIFPRFFQEMYNNTSSGMSLIESVRKSKEADYGNLTPLIRNMCLQVEWGVPLYLSLRSLGNKINNQFVKKIIILTEKASEFSPDIGKSMKEINEYIYLSKKLELKRKTELFPQLISFYLIFCVFLFIIFVIFNLFIPSFSLLSVGAYRTIFTHFILIESVLSGIVIGKITDDSFTAGLKHMIILLSISLVFLYLL